MRGEWTEQEAMVRTTAVIGLILSATVLGQDSGEKPVPAQRLVRDLSRLAPGKYEVIQSFNNKRITTLERAGAKTETSESRSWNRFTFDAVVTKKSERAGPTLAITVRRVELGIEGERKLSYDSDGPVEKQSEALRNQFRHMLGRTARVNLAAFGQGRGFTGLDAAWADYLKANPGSEHSAEANRKNYGDGRLDRMFAQGLDFLFGADAGRAAGRTRELKTGEKFTVKLEERGIGFKATPLDHACEVKSIDEGLAALTMSWKENGICMETTEEGAVLARGADVKCNATLVFQLKTGLLVGFSQELHRTDQVGGLSGQRTDRLTERLEFTFRAK